MSSLIITKSKSSISSDLRDENSDNVLNTNIGLILIYRFRCFLNTSNPCSGLSSRVLLSYLGVPTEASKTASDLRAFSKVSSVIGLLYLSREAPPTSPNS